MTFRCDVPGVQRAYDTEREAVAMAEELVRKGAKFVVVWEQGEPLGGVPEAAGSAHGDVVALGVTRSLQGRQIDVQESA